MIIQPSSSAPSALPTGSVTSTGAPTRIRPFLGIPTMVPEFVDGEFTGGIYKVEEKFFYDGVHGLRIHAWIKADPRIHNHPWEQIHCTVIRGGYTAKEYRRYDDCNYREDTVILKVGDTHTVPHDVFHQVVDVFPGTITLMRFTREVRNGPGDWGHLTLDPVGGFSTYTQAANAPLVDGKGFLPALQHLNPHLRPKTDWVDVYAEFPVPTLDEVLKSVGL